MDPAEISQLIGELEERVERLRSLYDQYFMGIERLEPTVLRKDVDRRLWALRREQIRNTGVRFKLETVIQRYNTYQQYWQRIVREIENGTYQRDLGRAAARFGEGSVTAFGKRRQKMFEKGQAKKAERDAQRGERTSTPPTEVAPASNHAAEAGSESYDVPIDDSDMFADQAPLSLDLSPPSRPPAAAHSAVARQDAVAPPSAAAVATKPVTPRAASGPGIKLIAVSPGTMVAPRTPSPPAPARATPAPPRPGQPAAPAPSQPGATAPRSPAGAQPNAGPSPVRPRLPSRPEAPSAPKPAPAAAGDEGLSATRLRQIYGQYVDAKRKANESTAAITFDKVAANLRETATQLRAKHKAAIDFEVVMKNGKPVLKPVVKG